MWLLIFCMAIIAMGSMMALRHPDDVDKDYCEVCTRWSECNGVDEECPWRSK